MNSPRSDGPGDWKMQTLPPNSQIEFSDAEDERDPMESTAKHVDNVQPQPRARQGSAGEGIDLGDRSHSNGSGSTDADTGSTHTEEHHQENPPPPPQAHVSHGVPPVRDSSEKLSHDATPREVGASSGSSTSLSNGQNGEAGSRSSLPVTPPVAGAGVPPESSGRAAAVALPGSDSSRRDRGKPDAREPVLSPTQRQQQQQQQQQHPKRSGHHSHSHTHRFRAVPSSQPTPADAAQSSDVPLLQHQQPMQWIQVPLSPPRDPCLAARNAATHGVGAGAGGNAQELLSGYSFSSLAEVTSSPYARPQRYPYWNVHPRYNASPNLAAACSPYTLALGPFSTPSNTVQITSPGSFVSRDNSFLAAGSAVGSPTMLLPGSVSFSRLNSSVLAIGSGSPSARAAAGPGGIGFATYLQRAPEQLSLVPPNGRMTPAMMAGDCILESWPHPQDGLTDEPGADVGLGLAAGDESTTTSNSDVGGGSAGNSLAAGRGRGAGGVTSGRRTGPPSQYNSAFYQPLLPPFKLTAGAHGIGSAVTPSRSTPTMTAVDSATRPAGTIDLSRRGTDSSDGEAVIDGVPQVLDRTARPGNENKDASSSPPPPAESVVSLAAAGSPLPDTAAVVTTSDSALSSGLEGRSADAQNTSVRDSIDQAGRDDASEGNQANGHAAAEGVKRSGDGNPQHLRYESFQDDDNGSTSVLSPQLDGTQVTRPLRPRAATQEGQSMQLQAFLDRSNAQAPGAGTRRSPAALSFGSDSLLLYSPQQVRSPLSREPSLGRTHADPVGSLDHTAWATDVSAFGAADPRTPANVRNKPALIHSLGERSLGSASTSALNGHYPAAGGAFFGVGAGGAGSSVGTPADVSPTLPQKFAGNGTLSAVTPTPPPAAPVVLGVCCPLEEMEDLAEVVRLFASDVHNVRSAIPSYLYSLHACTVDSLARLLALQDVLATTLLASAKDAATTRGCDVEEWRLLRENCESNIADSLLTIADRAVELAQSAKTVAMRKRIIAHWTLEALESAAVQAEEALEQALETSRRASVTPHSVRQQPLPPTRGAAGAKSSPSAEDVLTAAGATASPAAAVAAQGTAPADAKTSGSALSPTSHTSGQQQHWTSEAHRPVSSNSGRREGFSSSSPGSGIVDDERRPGAAAVVGQSVGVRELCALLSSDRQLREELDQRHFSFVGTCQRKIVRVALLRFLLVECVRATNSDGGSRTSRLRDREDNHHDVSLGSENEDSHSRVDSALTPPDAAEALASNADHEKYSNAIHACERDLLKLLSRGDRARFNQGSVYYLNHLPPYAELTRCFTELVKGESWTWWYNWQLATDVNVASRTKSMAHLERCMADYMDCSSSASSLLATLRGDRTHWLDEQLHHAENELRAVEQQYSSRTRMVLQMMLRRIVILTCMKDLPTVATQSPQQQRPLSPPPQSENSFGDAGSAVSGAGTSTVLAVLVTRLSAHRDSVRMARDELDSLTGQCDVDLQTLKGFLLKWKSLTSAQRSPESSTTPLFTTTPSTQRRLLALMEGCTNAHCSFCRDTGLYASSLDHIAVLQRALHSIRTAAELLLSILPKTRVSTDHAESDANEVERSGGSGGSHTAHSAVGVSTNSAAPTAAVWMEKDSGDGSAEDNTGSPSIAISLRLQPTLSARTNPFDEGEDTNAPDSNPRSPTRPGSARQHSAYNAHAHADADAPAERGQPAATPPVPQLAGRQTYLVNKPSTRALNRLKQSLDDLLTSVERNEAALKISP